MIAYCYSQELEGFSDRLPSNLGRSSLTHRLASAYKLLSHENLALLKTKPASHADLLNYHAPSYVETLLSLDENVSCSDEDAATYGLEYDCPIFDGLSAYVCHVAGASIEAARALIQPGNSIEIAINWDGGRHHAKRAAASGFCYVQDIVLAIQELRKTCSRVMYIDLDLHHGDGVEAAFVHSDKVFTLSLHRHDPGFFPNSGAFVEQGKGKGKGYNLNIPLKKGLSDKSFEVLIDEIVLPTIDAYIDTQVDQAIVVQCGVDSLALDPCKEWNLSIDGYCTAIAKIQMKATERRCKVLYLGGGGYNKTLASRCYSALLATLLEVKLGDIPEHSLWHEYADTNHELTSQECIKGMVDENIPLLEQTVTRCRERIGFLTKRSPRRLPEEIKHDANRTADVPQSWDTLPLTKLHGHIDLPDGLISNVLIMMHGLGDNARSFASLGKSFNLPETVVLSIQGPFPVPLMAGCASEACMWANDITFDDSNGIDDDGDFTTAERLIDDLINEIILRGLATERILFFGYGQGAMLALKMASKYGSNVISIGGVLPQNMGTGKGRHALICGGENESKITKSALSEAHRRFVHVAHLSWRQSGDALPKPSKKNSWLPIIQFFSRNVVQMRGVPAGAVQIN